MKRVPLLLALLCLSLPVWAQTGFPLYGSVQSGQVDSVNLQNLNIIVNLPIFSTTGRGTNFAESISNNSLIWTPVGNSWVPATVPGQWGWSISNSGNVTYTETTTNGKCGKCLQGGDGCSFTTTTTWKNWIYTDPAGTQHSFNTALSGVTATQSYNDCTGVTTTTGSYSGYSADGLYYMNINGQPSSGSPAPNTIWVYTSSGTRLDFTNSPNATVTDRNGNYTKATQGVNEVDWFDTTGREALKVVTSTSSPNIVFHYTDPTGTDQPITLDLLPNFRAEEDMIFAS